MSKRYNKSKHSDLVKLSPFLFQKTNTTSNATRDTPTKKTPVAGQDYGAHPFTH